MAFLPSLSAQELQHYHEVVTRSTEVRSHFDLLTWLQGDLQKYLPHEILIASWGAFDIGPLQYDVLSPLPGIRSRNLDAASLGAVMRALHQRWKEFSHKPFTVESSVGGFPLPVDAQAAANPVNRALGAMKNAIVHGIVDSRGNHDCLYVAFHSRNPFGEHERAALSAVLPYIDTALRQLRHLSPPKNASNAHVAQQHHNTAKETVPPMMGNHNLSDRESQILHWVAMGKTNPEIASILQISSFTVKNHMQRVFKKLDVSNRAQAVSKYRPAAQHVQD